jgi:hypothetical protein
MVVMPPERARTVLQHMIGGLQRKVREQELAEALAYLNEALVKLDQLSSHDELFASGLYLDFHGYKVSMREQLLSAEFVYLSVSLNARLHNRLEQWIGARERLHDAQQLTVDGTPREQIMRRLRAQEEEVDASFGVKRRTLTNARELARESRSPQRSVESKRAAATKQREKRGFNPSMLVLVLAALVAVAAAGYVLVRSGMLGKPEVIALDRNELERYSPLLVRGQVLGEGNTRRLRAWAQPKRWEALDRLQREQAADKLAKRLGEDGILAAEVLPLGQATPIMTIDGGRVGLVSAR